MKQLKPGYCPQNAAKSFGKGAARELKPDYCLTLHEGTRKNAWKAPRMPQKPPRKAPRRSESQATAPRMPQKPPARALRGI